MSRPALKPNEESFHICGDARDPTGISNKMGKQSTMDLTGSAIGHPEIRFDAGGEVFVITADVYREGGELLVHIICPLCSKPGDPHGLRITQSNKQMSYEDGLLSVEPFECTWESQGDLRRDFGMGRCGLRIAIDKNVARRV
jgi:hypothetical protein